MKNFLKNTTLLIFALIIAAGLAEAISRVVYPIQYGHKFFDAEGHRIFPAAGPNGLKPSLSYRQISQEFNKPTTHTDRGFRGPAGGFMDPEQPDLVFIGDSMTYGIGLADEETIPYLYCQRLKLHCVNLGRPGASTFDEVSRLSKYLMEYNWRPKKVSMIMNAMTAAQFGGNDFTDNAQHQQMPRPPSGQPKAQKPKLAKNASSFLKRLIDYRKDLLEHSNLARVSYYILAPMLREKLNPDLSQEEFTQSMNATQKALQKLDDLARAYGFEYTIYIVHPMQDLTRGTYQKTVEDIQSIAPRKNVIGTGSALLDTGNPVDYYYPLDGHVRPAAAQKIAAFMAGGKAVTSP